jgi:hypothetical protein
MKVLQTNKAGISSVVDLWYVMKTNKIEKHEWYGVQDGCTDTNIMLHSWQLRQFPLSPNPYVSRQKETSVTSLAFTRNGRGVATVDQWVGLIFLYASNYMYLFSISVDRFDFWTGGFVCSYDLYFVLYISMIIFFEGLQK